jgi:hypothetical protein
MFLVLIIFTLLVSKYRDHQPLYRQLEIFKRSGVHPAASTVNDRCRSAINLLEPLYQKLRQHVLSCDYIQIDESTIPVLDKGSRAQHVAIELLKDFKGAVQSDGYGVYDIYEKTQGVLLLGCWAHACRKFEQAQGNDPPRAEFALQQIGRLYEPDRMLTIYQSTIENFKIKV